MKHKLTYILLWVIAGIVLFSTFARAAEAGELELSSGPMFGVKALGSTEYTNGMLTSVAYSPLRYKSIQLYTSLDYLCLTYPSDQEAFGVSVKARQKIWRGLGWYMQAGVLRWVNNEDYEREDTTGITNFTLQPGLSYRWESIGVDLGGFHISNCGTSLPTRSNNGLNGVTLKFNVYF